jgi:hypothetical protein
LCPERISCVIDKYVQRELMKYVVDQWEVLDSIVESAFERRKR